MMTHSQQLFLLCTLYLKQSSNHQHKEEGKQTEREQVQSHNYLHHLAKII